MKHSCEKKLQLHEEHALYGVRKDEKQACGLIQEKAEVIMLEGEAHRTTVFPERGSRETPRKMRFKVSVK